MSVLQRLWQRVFRRSYLVGKDFEGNQYLEFPNASNGRPKRIIQYSNNDDMHAYVASGKRLPVQWNAWLTHTRREPPTLEELQADIVRQQRVQVNVAQLEARQREERAHPAALGVPSRSRTISRPDLAKAQLLVRSAQRVPDANANDPWSEADARKGSQEPQTWGPVIRRR